MDITEVIDMGDKILGRLSEDASAMASKKNGGSERKDPTEPDNSGLTPIKRNINNNMQQTLDLQQKLKETKIAKTVATNPKALENLRTTETNIQAKIANLNAERKQNRNIMQQLQDSADIPDPNEKDGSEEESDDDLKKDAKDFDADLKEESVSDLNESSDENDVIKAKSNAVITGCENQKEKLKEAEAAKISVIKEATARRVETINQKEEAAKAMKGKAQSSDLQAKEKQQAQNETDEQETEQESMEPNDGSAEIQEAFENIRSRIIHSKIDRLTNKANEIKTKLSSGKINDKKAEKLHKKLDEINGKLANLTGSDSEGNQVKDFESTPYGKLNQDINKKNAGKHGFEKEESMFVDDGIDALIESCDQILNEDDGPENAQAAKKADQPKKPELTGLAKHVYDHAMGTAKCDDERCSKICDAVKNSPDGKSTISKITAELSKEEPSAKTLALLKADLERIYGYVEKQFK